MSDSIKLSDNRYGEDISEQPDEILAILKQYDGKTISEFEKLGVNILSAPSPKGESHDDGSDDLSLYTLGNYSEKTWINTHNCMGVVKLRDKNSGKSIQIEIGSRFDEKNKNQFFLTYLLSKVFGGSFVEANLGRDSLWDMLLAFIFRRHLHDAISVGLYKQYRTYYHNDARLRGRIDVNELLRRNIPFCGNVAYTTHDITFDNPTNHLIRHALTKVERKWGLMLQGDNRLVEIKNLLKQNTPTWHQFDIISCIRRKENRTPIKHPYFHTHYEPLRQISLSILREEGASLYEQKQEAEGVIFDGSWLWEEYLWALLKPLGFKHPENKNDRGAWKPVSGAKFFPDFFHEEMRVILDAKYQRAGHIQDGARQVFAYMFLLDAAHGGLIKPDRETNSEPQNINRLRGGESFWHNISLTPPEEKNAKDFIKKMTANESDFQDYIRNLMR